jgi:hypothetical protein
MSLLQKIKNWLSCKDLDQPGCCYEYADEPPTYEHVRKSITTQEWERIRNSRIEREEAEDD